MFNNLLILFCRQTLSLKPPASLGRRFCHPLPQNGDNSRQTWPVSTSMEIQGEVPLWKIWHWWRDL